MMKISLSLERKLAFQFSFISLMGLAIFAVVTYLLFSKLVLVLIRQDIESRIQAARAAIEITNDENLGRQRKIAELITRKLSNRILVTPNTVSQVAENQITHEKISVNVPEFLLDRSRITQHSVVDAIADNTQSEVTLFVTIPEGLLRVSTTVLNKDGTRSIGTFIPNSSPVYQALSSGKPYFGRAYVVDAWYITAYEPLVQDNKAVGAIFVGSRETAGNKIKDYLKSQKLLETGYFFILDSLGNLVLHPSKEGQNVLSDKDLDGTPIFQEMINKRQGWIEYRWLNAATHESQDKVALFQHFPVMDWIVAASFNKAELYFGINRVTAWLVGLSILFTLITGLLVSHSAKRIAQVLNVIVSGLNDVINSVFQRSRDIAKSSVDLSAESSRQASALQETATAIEEIQAIAKQNLDSTELSAELSAKTKSAAENGFAVVEELNQAVADMDQSNAKTKAEIAASYQQIQQISQLILGISEKTKLINDIVFQTKLLSFNASVEAARAGEHGNGFAVVAEEVGNLAAMAGSSAHEIQTTLQDGIQKVTYIIESSEKRINNSFETSSAQTAKCVKIASECKQSLQSILENGLKTYDALNQITTASGEQVKAIEQVSIAIQQIDQATQNNALLAQKTENYSSELGRQSEELRQASLELNELVHGAAETEHDNAGSPDEAETIEIVA